MILHKIKNDWFMERRLYFGAWSLVAAFDTLALFTLLMVMTWNTTHDGGYTEEMLVNLWGIWFLIPGFVITFAVCIGLGASSVKPLPKEWKPDN